MSYDQKFRPNRNFAVVLLIVLQLAVLFASVTEFSQISPFCGIPRNGMPAWVGYAHAVYPILLLTGIVGLFFRRVALLYIVALPLALLFLPFQLWGLDQDYFYCDGP